MSFLQEKCSMFVPTHPSEMVGFSCGDEDLDNFIIKESADYTKSLLSITYIVTDKSKNRVVAYFRQTIR